MLGQIQGHGLAVQAALCNQADEGTFQFADVCVDRIGEVLHDLTWQFNAVGVHLLLQNRHAGFQTRHLHVGTQPPLEAGEEALLHALHFNRRLVACQDNLLACLVQVIKNMEEDVLCLLLAAEELNVVYNEHVHQLIEVREVVHAVVADGIDELMRELL